MQTGPTEPTWDDLRVLLALHRHHSFLAAGKALAVSTSTVARRVAALEEALGRPLVVRTSVGTLIEPDAMVLVRLAEELETGLRGARRTAGDESVSGVVRISMPDAFARPVTAFLAALRRREPDLRFDVHCDARPVDLARREADIAVRAVRSSSPVVVDRLVGRLEVGLYAAPAYVERRLGEPKLKRADVPRHDFVGYDREWERVPPHQWLLSLGASRFSFRTNTDDALVEAIVGGFGIGPMTATQARALPVTHVQIDAEGPRLPLYLSFHRDLRKVPRVRRVLDALERGIREAL